MKDEDKPRELLISEITELRQQLGESKSSLEELKKSEVKYRMLAEATPAYIHVTQGNKFVYINPGAVTFAGYAREELMALDFWDYIHPEFKELVKENHFLRQRGDKGPERYEFKVVAKNGQEHWVELNARAVDWEGEPAVAALAYDITGHKKTEEELHRAHSILEMRVQERTAELARANEALRAEIAERRQTEDQLRAAHQQLSEIIEFLPDATLVIDKGRRVIAWNKAIEEMTGVRKEEIIGKGNYAYAVPFYGEPRSILIDLVFMEDRETAQKYLYTEKVGDAIYAETSIPSLYKGRDAYLWGKASPLYSSEGVVIGAIESIRDITMHKRAEQEVREQLNFLQVLIDAIPTPIYYKDPNEIYQGCNKAYEIMLDQPKENIVGKTAYDIWPKELADIYHRMDIELLSHSGVQVFDSKVRFADGLIHDVNFHKATYKNLTGHLAGLVGVFIDITVHKQIAKMLRQTASELQAVFQALPDLYFRLSADGTFLDVQAGRLSDLYLPIEELLGKRIQDTSRRLAQQFQQAIDQTLRTRSLVMIEYALTIGGEKKLFEARFLPLLEDQVVVVVRNITERIQMEGRLRKSEQEYRTIFETTSTAMLIVEDDTTISLANQEFARLSGYSIEEVEGKKSWSVFAGYDYLDMMMEYHRIRRSGSLDVPRQYEAEFIDRRGNIISVLITAAMIPATKKSVLSFLDITKRKHAEAALRESEEQLRRIADNMLDMVCQTDARGIVQYASPSNESVVGYNPKDLIGKPVFNFVHPADLNKAITALQTFQAAINASSGGKIEFRFKHADGRYLWVEIVGKPLFDDMGTVVGAIFGGRDITERKMAEQETREQLHFLQVLIDAIPAPIFYKDLEGIYQGCNNAFASMLGMSKEDIIGKSAFGALPEEEGNKHRKMDLDLFNNPGVQVYDYKIRSADGLDHDVIFHKATYNDLSGRLAGLVGAVIDVTRLKQVEEKLRQRAAELQAVFQALPDLYFRLSVDGTFLELLAGPPDDLYLPVEEFLGKRIQDVFKYLGPQFQQINEQVLQKRSLFIMEYPLTLKGETKFFEARLFPLLEDQVILVVRNITERKRDDEELKKYREHLEVLVEQRTAELKEINKELESFSYSVSHDLRSPLRIIDGYSRVLEEDYLEILGNEGMKNIQIIRSQCQRMGELINDILDLSRLSRKEMQLEEVNLSQLAESIAAELQRSEPERQVNFIITPNLEVRGDKQLFQSVLENLMNNAWKFTSKHPQAKIELGVKKIGGNKAYFVRDDGAGFDMKYVQKLFGAFQRLHTIDEFPGTGVGLAIVQRIVHRHGGQVWAEGAEEKGATFYFTLDRQISGGDNHGRKSDTSG
ncbi:MAG: PAS domain S-box protein [Thermacetogeniaceae bacterium]